MSICTAYFQRQSLMISLKQKFILTIVNSGLKKGGDFRNTNLPIFAVCDICWSFQFKSENKYYQKPVNERCIYSDNLCAYLGKET